MISTSWTSLPLFAYIDSKMMKPSIAVVSEFFFGDLFFFGGGRGFFYQDFDFLGCRLSGRCAATFWPGMSTPRCPKTHQWPNATDYIISSHSFLGRGNEKTLPHRFLSPFTASNGIGLRHLWSSFLCGWVVGCCWFYFCNAFFSRRHAMVNMFELNQPNHSQRPL